MENMKKLILKILNKKITQDIFLYLCVIAFFAIFFAIIALGQGALLWLKLKIVSVLGFKISNFF